jgi:hypothetical protein
MSLGSSASSGSGVVEDKAIGFVGFTYETNLRYLVYNEYNSAVAGTPPAPFSNNVRFTPYNFQSRALAAWEKAAINAKLPNPYLFITGKKI